MVMSVTANDRYWTAVQYGNVPSRRIIGTDVKPYAQYPVQLDEVADEAYALGRRPHRAYQWSGSNGLGGGPFRPMVLDEAMDEVQDEAAYARRYGVNWYNNPHDDSAAYGRRYGVNWSRGVHDQSVAEARRASRGRAHDTIPASGCQASRWVGTLALVTAGSVLGAVIAKKVFKV